MGSSFIDKKTKPRTQDSGLRTRLLALVPTYNEEKIIADTIGALKGLGSVIKVVVVDDCSSDKTVDIAKEAGAEVIVHPKNLGKGLSLDSALWQIDLASIDAVILADGDLGKTAAEFKHLIDAYSPEETGLIIAAFGKPKKKGGFGLVKGLASWAIKKHKGPQVVSPLSGQRIIDTQLLPYLLPLAPGFGIEIDMTLKALKNGFKIIEVPTKMSHNETGRNLAGFMHRGRQFKDVLKEVVKHGFIS